MTAIDMRAVSKYFPKAGRPSLKHLVFGMSPQDRFTAVSNVTLQVPQGEVVGVLGRNGAGKSTLLRVVGGIYSPDEGAIWLGGDTAGLFELGGFGSTQLTGREFANRYLQIFGTRRASRRELVEEIRAFSELEEYFDERIRTYSAGMAARLYFAAATAVPHYIYLIDEILSVGDEHFQAKSWARIRERLAGGASGLLVTHDWSAVIRLCRESKVLDAGQIVKSGPSDAVVAEYLDLERPSGFRARVLEPSPEALCGVSGEDCQIALEIVVEEELSAQVAFSIEALQLGTGWEPVLLTEYADVGRGPGRFLVTLNVPTLPLAPGSYSFALFLTSKPSEVNGIREVLDARSWTYGNGLVFRVSGDSRGDIAPFPVHWQEET